MTNKAIAAMFEGALAQHTALLGKTGSGKTITGKLMVEQVVARGARVCILDPLKSDWWGLISSADGKRPGLPFHILGGPRGHLPLHSSAGKAIGEIVANGSLPLSIIDMADFEPGGQVKFFVEFAQTLFRKVRGVVYLVVEEAHQFAPKERSGIGAENMSIHWAKTLATASRSKGIRLILLTQRNQALHNALLGSCDTIIAHRLIAPADQEPIVKWLKANTSREVMERVSSELSSLRTGTGWFCSGEAKVFERVEFPMIATYDNTATPTDDDQGRHEVKTAPVDSEKLRAIIGAAVKDAEASDPKALRAKVAKLEHDLVAMTTRAEAAEKRAQSGPAKVTTIEKPVVGMKAAAGIQKAEREMRKTLQSLRKVSDAFVVTADRVGNEVDRLAVEFQKVTQPPPAAPVMMTISPPVRHFAKPAPKPPARIIHRDPAYTPAGTNEVLLPVGGISRLQRIMLTVLAQHGPCRLAKLAVLSGYVVNGTVYNALGYSRRDGYIVGGNQDEMSITDAGLAVLGSYDPLPTGEALRQNWLNKFGSFPGQILRELINNRDGYTLSELSERIGRQVNGTFYNALGKLRTAGVLVGENREVMRASDLLF